MKQLKRHLPIIVILTLFPILFSGCHGRRESAVYKIGISQCSDDDWRKKMNQEIEREVMVQPDVKVEIRSADDSNEKQIADIEYFVENGFDLIIVAPNEAEALTPVIDKVYRQGIPVILFDRNIKSDSFTAWQGADNDQIGQMAAHYAARLERETPGNGKIIELRGRQGSTPALERHTGFAATVADTPSLNIVASAVGNWTYEEATPVIDSLYNLYPDVDIVYAHNDRMAIAASDIAKRRGLHPRIIGIDAAPGIGINAVKDSVIDATFLYPTEGHQLIRTARAILKGEKYDRILELPSASAVDSSNADILLLQNAALIEESDKLRKLKEEIDKYWEKHNAQTVLFYAAVAILMLFAGMLFFILRLYWQNRRHQRELEEHNRIVEEERDKQEYLNQELQKATQSKLVFFTNVSHDLRTPLTLIAEPVDQLKDAQNLTSGQKELMHIASKNVRILKRLINQILDFRKYENGKVDLNLRETNLVSLLTEWTDSFRALARKRDIRFSLLIEDKENLTLAIDTEKIERVFFNLVSNAFKHTPANGHIDIRCGCDGDYLRFSVADTGEGIAAADLQHIFERFFQVESIRPNGSGIGLALTKSFVELHGGTLDVKSEPGKGSVFTVTIPVKHVEEKGDQSGHITESEVLAEVAPVEGTAPQFDSDKPMVLVIEDNDDMRRMVAALLGDDYNVALAPDGKEGLRMAARYVPDLIVSDVMMPVMNGLECCRRIKEEVTTSHIPVLLLTACTLDEQKAAGYDSGADGYLAKPFSREVLLARCRSLLANRRRIRDLWSAPSVVMNEDATGKKGKEAAKEKAVERSQETGPLDNEFYNRFLKKVEERIGDSDLNVDALASDLGLGRSQFYRKIKALTNYSPVELLRRLRLQRARTLLTTTDKSISEIAYEVGFSTPAYFTKCFRDSFGQTPTELREKLGG